MAMQPGKGTLLYANTAASTTMVARGQVTSITPHSAEVGSVETTDLDQTWRTHRPTVSVGGQLQFAINYDPTNITGEWAKTLIGTPASTITFRVVPTSPSTVHYPQFLGILTGFAPGPLTVDGIHTAELSVQITGAITFVD